MHFIQSVCGPACICSCAREEEACTAHALGLGPSPPGLASADKFDVPAAALKGAVADAQRLGMWEDVHALPHECWAVLDCVLRCRSLHPTQLPRHAQRRAGRPSATRRHVLYNWILVNS